MSERPVTSKKECPKCQSQRVTYQGIGSGAGTETQSGQLPPITSHAFRCDKCGLDFWYRGQL